MPRVGNQGRQGSCVGWAVGYAARSYYEFSSDGLSLEIESNIASPGFIYDAIRVDPYDCDRGSRVADALNLLRDHGTQSSAEYAYNDRTCQPNDVTTYASALGFRIKSWLRVDTDRLDQVKGELALGHPVIISAVLNDDFFGLRSDTPTWRAGAIQPSETGGHAMTVVGYDDRTERFKFINSWGENWASDGYAFMDYETFSHRVYAAYVIRSERPPRRPVPVERPDVPEPDVVIVDLDLPTFQCGSVRAEAGEAGTVIRGFVSHELDLTSLRERYSEYAFDVQVRPWPMCEALLIAERPNEAAQIELLSSSTAVGDDLVFNVTTPSFSSHLHLAYFQADGNVVNLLQSALPQLVTYEPFTELVLGDGQNGYGRFEVSGPVGDELILAITTRSPLFSRQRPLVEPARDFLSELRAATIDLDANTGISRYYGAGHLAVRTVEN